MPWWKVALYTFAATAPICAAQVVVFWWICRDEQRARCRAMREWLYGMREQLERHKEYHDEG